jgi:hypothetical protein
MSIYHRQEKEESHTSRREKMALKQPPWRRRQKWNDYIKMEFEKIVVVIDFRYKRRRINYSRAVQLQTIQDAQSTVGPHYH